MVVTEYRDERPPNNARFACQAIVTEEGSVEEARAQSEVVSSYLEALWNPQAEPALPKSQTLIL